MVAWDGSRPAARAVADALPILERAKEVRVLTVVNEKELGSEAPAAELARYLGVTTSCVNRFISTGKKPDMDLAHML